MTATKETVVLQGYVTEKLVCKKGTRFKFKDGEGVEHVAITFGEWKNEYLGEPVKFHATYNEQYKNYSVVGEIEMLEESSVVEPVAAEVPKKKASTTKTVTKPSGSGREAFRDEAEEAALLNLQSAQKIAKKLKLDTANIEGLVALADIVGRTQTAIFMDAAKDRRMKNFKK